VKQPLPPSGARLLALVNDAIEAAREHKSVIFHPVNWADLRCVDVEVRSSLITGDVIFAVTISEASPDAVDLQAFVGEWLDARGWRNVLVETEW
jgi:hypothetical protein